MGTGWWVADFLRAFGPAFVIAWAFWIIFSICLHELSHGWAAIALGDRTPIESGHMTFNPLVHMGGMSLVAFALIGIAWGAMPINPARLRGRYAEAIVALAGPAMNLVLAGTSLGLLALWLGFIEGQWAGGVSLPDAARRNMIYLFRLGLMLNLLLALFNLLPVMPLDGGRVLANLSPEYRRIFEGERGAYIMIAVLVLLFMFAGRVIIPFSFDLAIDIEAKVLGLLGLQVPTIE